MSPKHYTKIMTALTLADGLMADDKASFKRGYTRPNAEIAAIESVKLNEEETASFRRIMDQKYPEK